MGGPDPGGGPRSPTAGSSTGPRFGSLQGDYGVFDEEDVFDLTPDNAMRWISTYRSLLGFLRSADAPEVFGLATRAERAREVRNVAARLGYWEQVLARTSHHSESQPHPEPDR